jgi:hypothetical protein
LISALPRLLLRVALSCRLNTPQPG